jgi:localization factor PodJL
MANWNMSFEEAEIRRKMGEIADWLKDQAEPQTAAPRLHAVSAESEAEAEPVLPPRVAEEGSLAGIVERRLAARREREEAAKPEISSLREVMDRFSGPLTAPPDPTKRGPLRSAVAEIVERQRELDSERPQPLSEPHPLRRAAARPMEQGSTENMEFAFERLVTRFEERAAQSFQTLEASLADVRRLIEDAKTPIEAAEAAAAYIVQTKLHALETDTNNRIEEVARDLASFRSDTTDSERRTRDLLEAVRKTLEHVASRLPERLGQAVPALAPEANPSVRARAAALRAIEESTESEPFDLLVRHKVAEPERRHYIAAARRSTQPAEPQETTTKYRPLGAPPRPRPAMVTAAEPHSRFRMKRTLLASSAAAVLLLGIYAGSSRFLDDMFSGQQTAVLPDEGAAQTQTAASSVATPDAESATTGAGEQNSPGLLSAQPASPGTFLPNEPVITGSIPQNIPQSFPQNEPRLAPLPTDIGGQRLRERAEAGNAAAQYEAGMRFLEARGVPRDYEKAAAWLERAAAQGLAPAQYRLGSLMEKGNGLPKDLEGARRLYEQAANAGNIQAMHNLGVLYAEGGLGQPDMAIALVWFQKAADYGVKDSQFNLGIFYAKGLAVPKDFSQSYMWFTLAAAQGDKDAADKREQIGAKIDAEKIKALKVSADTWKPKTAVFEANNVLPPAEGWDNTPNARAGAPGKTKPI